MPPSKSHIALGLDFGTESARAILVNTSGGELASAVSKYKHGQIISHLPDSDKPLPPDFALQHPSDWLNSAARATRAVLKTAKINPTQIIGIGVDFTSCTMLPSLADGTPLCLTKKFATNPYAWPKLWKHHAAKKETDLINEIAHARKEKWLRDYGGIIGLEWFFPKTLETLNHAPSVYSAADLFIEAGDWFVWKLIGAPSNYIPRSTCQAGYKAMWNAKTGYPSKAFFKALNPKFENVIEQKVPGKLYAPGTQVGTLAPSIAKRLNLPSDIPVSAATIDAHAGVPGAGACDPNTLVMVMGTSSCHMLNAKSAKHVPGVAGVVKEGILPNLYGYETGQAAVGDAFDWIRKLTGQSNFNELTKDAEQIPPRSDGVLCIDWFNGCRTPLMDGSLTGAFTGLTLRHTPAHLYHALLEASACGVRWIVDELQSAGVPVKKYIATGGLPHHNPLLVQVYADVLGQPITVHPCQHGPALGAAILGALAAGKKQGGHDSAQTAIKQMAAPSKRTAMKATTVRPRRPNIPTYNTLYQNYRKFANLIKDH